MTIGMPRRLATVIAMFTVVAPAWTAGSESARTAVDEIPWPAQSAREKGTAMRSGLQTVIIAGDAKAPGLYTMMVRLPPLTRVPPHSHPDER